MQPTQPSHFSFGTKCYLTSFGITAAQKLNKNSPETTGKTPDPKKSLGNMNSLTT